MRLWLLNKVKHQLTQQGFQNPLAENHGDVFQWLAQSTARSRIDNLWGVVVSEVYEDQYWNVDEQEVAVPEVLYTIFLDMGKEIADFIV